MNCTESLKKLYYFLDGEIEKVPKIEIEKHLNRCRHCWDHFEFEKRLKELIKKSCCKVVCPDTLKRRVKDLLDKY